MNINATLIGQTISFVLLVIITVKWIWPPLAAAMEERRKKIAEGLEAAERSKSDLAEAESKIAEMLKEAKMEAVEILDAAHKRSAEIVAQSRHEAHAEGEKILAHTQAQIQSEIKQAQSELRKQVSELVVLGAGKILDREINAQDHTSIINELAVQIEGE